MGDNIQEWYIRPEGEAFDLSVYDTYTDYFSIKLHYVRRFTDSPNKKYVDGSSDEDGEGDSENDSEDGHSDANDIIDEEHLVDEVEVNMSAFNFQIYEEGEDGQVDHIQPLLTLTEDDLEVLDYDSLESKEFANRDLAKERIRAYSVETRRNIDFKRNEKRRIREICKGVVPSMASKNVFVDKDEGPKKDITRNGDKAKWLVKTYKDEHKCLQSKKIKHCTSTLLAKHITYLLIMNPEIPVKAIQEQMQKKFHVVVSKTKAFRAKAMAQVHLKGNVTVQYYLLTDYVSELQRCNLVTTVKIDVYREEDPEKTTRMFRRIYVCLGALKRGFKEGGRELLGLDGAFMRGQYPGQML
ncbi:hypothetical protein Tco_0226794 [Tanacetum coccineum]